MKLLFIGPQFYNYEVEIIKELNRQGYQVDYFKERNDYLDSVSHFLSKFVPRFRKLNKLYDSYIWSKIKNNKYDFFLLIRADSISEEMVKNIQTKCLYKRDSCVYYSWDSLANVENAKSIIEHFERKYTFDREDSIKLPGFSFLPLFYINTYIHNTKKEKIEKKYDIGIVASFTPQRYEIIQKCEKSGLSVYFSLFIKKYLYWKQLVTNSNYRLFDKKYISHKTISSDEIAEIYRSCSAVLDTPSKNQSGLSMRTLECLGMHKKLITTNMDVVNYDFYKYSNIFCLSSIDDQLEDLIEWLDLPYENVDYEIENKYSITNWIKTLIP